MSPSNDFKLLNQTLVRFSSGAYDGVAYSNTVQTPLAGPVITAAITAVPRKLSRNQTVTFTVTVSNNGNRTAEARLVDLLPAGLSFIPNSVLLNGSPLPGASPLNGFSIGSLPVGSTVQVIFQAIVIFIPQPHVFHNEAELAYTFTTMDGRVITDSVLSNQVTMEVAPFQLEVHASFSSPVTFLGDVIFYDLVIRNEGLLPMENIIVLLPLPEEFEFIPGSVVIDGVLVPWIDPAAGIYIGFLAPGAEVTVRVAIRLAQMPAETQIPFQAIIDYTVNGTVFRTLANLLVLSITNPAITVNLTVSRTKAPTNSRLLYTVTVINENSFAIDAYLSRLMPQGAAFLPDSVVIDGIPRKGVAGGVPLGTLLAGTKTVIAYEVQIEAAEIPQILNQVETIYTYRLTDGRLVKQQAASNPVITEIYGPVITVQASAKPMYYEVEHSVYFTIFVQNRGNLAAEVGLFRSDYPKGFYLLDPQINDRRVPSFTLENGLDLGLLAPGAAAKVGYWIYVSDSEEMDDELLTQVATRCTARYSYNYEDSKHTGESLSNELILPIDQNFE